MFSNYFILYKDTLQLFSSNTAEKYSDISYVNTIKWNLENWTSKNNLYERSKQKQWSKTILHRLKFFGLVARLDENTPALLSLKEALRTTNRTIEKLKTTFLSCLKSDFTNMNISFQEALDRDQSREEWRKTIYTSMFLCEKNKLLLYYY